MARDTAARRKRKSLDAIEGEGTNYARHAITVKSANGDLLAAFLLYPCLLRGSE
jgi:hypothetical protein